MTHIEPFCWSQILEGTYQVLRPDIDQNGSSWDCIQMNEHGYIQLNKNGYGNLCDEVQNEWLECSFTGSVNNNAKEWNNIRRCPAVESNVDTPWVLLYFNKLNAGLTGIILRRTWSFFPTWTLEMLWISFTSCKSVDSNRVSTFAYSILRINWSSRSLTIANGQWHSDTQHKIRYQSSALLYVDPCA